MKYALMALALALCLAAVGCANEVYERNLQYMTAPTYEAEKVIIAKRLDEAQAELSKAQASGDPERIKKATADFNVAKAKARSIDNEERRRNWKY
jgi:hypothetical protein